MKSKKMILMVLALTLAACLSIAALAESPTDSSAAAGSTEAAQAAVDAAAAESTALQEALEAYQKAKSESRKVEKLAKLKEELDGYVAAGSLTQEQADLILTHYAEQMVTQKSGTGFGRGGKGIRNGQNCVGGDQSKYGKGAWNGQNSTGTDQSKSGTDTQNGQNSTETNKNGNGRNGRHGRPGSRTAPNSTTTDTTTAAPSVTTTAPAGV